MDKSKETQNSIPRWLTLPLAIVQMAFATAVAAFFMSYADDSFAGLFADNQIIQIIALVLIWVAAFIIARAGIHRLFR